MKRKVYKKDVRRDFSKTVRNFSLHQLKLVRNRIEIKGLEFDREAKLKIIDMEIERKKENLLRGERNGKKS